MNSENTQKQIDDLRELLKKEKENEAIEEKANQTAFIVSKIYEAFRDSGFQHLNAYELTKIWCVKNFGK
jgi:hypothetical protein